jgi:squalene-hopene/tetraprenyl-beta-curcumene cyclase
MTAEEALNQAVKMLLAELSPEGHWEGRLSSSALAGAMAILSLHLNGEASDRDRIDQGFRWLARTQCEDGGWGDCPKSSSNPSTTILVLSAYRIAGRENNAGAFDYLRKVLGDDIATGVRRIYGEDHTFSVPILMTCAVAGLVQWNQVPRLPYPLAVMPHRLYKMVRLQVVSYALPALIAVGLAIDKRRGQSLLGSMVERHVLRILEKIQPESGGFLEAVPLTAFVALSLMSMDSPGYRRPDSTKRVLDKALSFLRKLQRPDGSWPIDTNLAIWVTSGAVNALRAAGVESPASALAWLAKSQTQSIHSFTNAEPGGWGWTDLSGSVPDSDDTSGVLVALSVCADEASGSIPSMDPFLPCRQKGLRWLMNLQNSDGGWPPFCRGWGKLPFDRSCTDITAHALRALLANGQGDCSCILKGFKFLERMQHEDGSWTPLWFGSQQTRDRTNPVFGTARVLMSYGEFHRTDPACRAGIDYLLSAQNEDGGWGAARAVPSMLQETALAVSALSFFGKQANVNAVILKGRKKLIEFIERDGLNDARPIGLYFEKLWYSERLYPMIWAVQALAQSRG